MPKHGVLLITPFRKHFVGKELPRQPAVRQAVRMSACGRRLPSLSEDHDHMLPPTARLRPLSQHPHLPLCGLAALSDRVVSARLVGRAGRYDWEVFVRKQICMELRPRCGAWAKDLERSPEEVLDRWLV